MLRRYRPSDISIISAPTTSANLRNSRAHPAIELGCCTPSQMLSSTGVSHGGTVCFIGDDSRGIGIVKAMIRRSRKPFLLLDAESIRSTLSSTLEADWTLDSAQSDLPVGNGKILFSDPYSSYLELCEYIREWSKDRYLILHLGNGLQIGIEVLNQLNSIPECLIICESIPQSLRESESRGISPLEFLKKMKHLVVSSIGSSSKDLVELLPTYQYETVSNAMNFNTYRGRSILHPFRGHSGHGISMGQTRTMDFKKSLFEVDDLKRIFDDGYMLTYNAVNDSVYIVRVI